MTEQELNVFLNLEWNCAAFTPDTELISAPLSPKQWVTGSGSSSTTHGFGLTAPVRRSSQNRCGGAFFSVPRSC